MRTGPSYIYISMLTIIVGDWPLPRSPGVPREMLTTCEAVSLRPPGALHVPSRQGSIRTTLPKSPKADCKEVLRTLGVAGVACSRKCPCTYMNFPSTFHELSMSFHKVSMNRDPSFDPQVGKFQRERPNESILHGRNWTIPKRNLQRENLKETSPKGNFPWEDSKRKIPVGQFQWEKHFQLDKFNGKIPNKNVELETSDRTSPKGKHQR